ncbi:MAG: glycosyltransferase [Erysipelotrichaceae bacterium]|nr:glycosyltransferase [Erysipelotrichaceae bacterium]
MMNEYKVAVLIPCYNESVTIKKVVEDYREAFPKADIYVYDNNSTDGTDKIAKEAGAIVRYEYKQGKGNVVRSMFKDIDADCYIMTDGDDTYPPIPEMVNIIQNHEADMVIGDRLSGTYFQENTREFHNFGNVLVRWLINRLFHVNIHDIMTGSRAFNYEFVKTFPVLSEGFELETEMTIHAVSHHLRIKEIPVQYRDRPEGSESKLNTISDGTKVLKTIFSLLKEEKPMTFFSVLALIFFILTLVFAVPVFHEYFQTGLVPRIPTLIFSGFLLVISLLLFIAGMILDNIKKKELQQFELLWIRTKNERS